jgi:hypothetical protein
VKGSAYHPPRLNVIPKKNCVVTLSSDVGNNYCPINFFEKETYFAADGDREHKQGNFASGDYVNFFEF